MKIPLAYTPVREWQDSDGLWLEEPFLPEDPLEMLRKGRIVSDVPTITGITQDEGTPLAASKLKNFKICLSPHEPCNPPEKIII